MAAHEDRRLAAARASIKAAGKNPGRFYREREFESLKSDFEVLAKSRAERDGELLLSFAKLLLVAEAEAKTGNAAIRSLATEPHHDKLTEQLLQEDLPHAEPQAIALGALWRRTIQSNDSNAERLVYSVLEKGKPVLSRVIVDWVLSLTPEKDKFQKKTALLIAAMRSDREDIHDYMRDCYTILGSYVLDKLFDKVENGPVRDEMIKIVRNEERDQHTRAAALRALAKHAEGEGGQALGQVGDLITLVLREYRKLQLRHRTDDHLLVAARFWKGKLRQAG